MTKYSRGIQQQLLQEHRRRRRRSGKKQIVTLSFGSNCNAGTNLANGETFDILSLSYHLGAIRGLLDIFSGRHRDEQKRYSPSLSSSLSSSPHFLVKAATGSGVGAIAAAVLARIPHRIDEYAHLILSDYDNNDGNDDENYGSNRRGNTTTATTTGKTKRKKKTPLEYLRSFIHEEETGGSVIRAPAHISTSLHIATTDCTNATNTNVFNFDAFPSQLSAGNAGTVDGLIETLRASCTVPSSFRMLDLFLPPLGGGDGGEDINKNTDHSYSYPSEQGVCIDGSYHAHGGISSHCPSTPYDSYDDILPIAISPMSHDDYDDDDDGYNDPGGVVKGDNGRIAKEKPVRLRISPRDDTWKLIPMVRNVKIPCDFSVKPSIQNFQVLLQSSSSSPSYTPSSFFGRHSTPTSMREWYELGINDTVRILGKMS